MYKSKSENIDEILLSSGAYVVSVEMSDAIFSNHLNNKSEKRKQLVNSYHNIIITKKSKKVDIFAVASDNSIEAFCHNKLKIGGVIWHPERFKKFRNKDIKIIKKFYATGNFGFRKR